MRFLLLLLPLLAAAVQAQSPDFTKAPPNRPLRLVVWSTPGAIPVPSGPDWQFEHLQVYDHANRVVALLRKADGDLNVSYLIFPNLSGKPTAEGCQSDVMDPLLEHFKGDITKTQRAQVKGPGGKSYPSTSYYLGIEHTKVSLYNVFAFAGDANTCAEIHLSTVRPGKAADAAIDATIAVFAPELTYKPTPLDLYLIGSLLFTSDPENAAPFYGTALEHLPVNPDSLTARRVTTDQLVMSLGMSGHLNASRHFADEAIKTDPDYPLNYYNLACADAEEGKAAAARTHLEQAFARKENMLPGEHMPDPTKDDSILKLKDNREFWTYVQTLGPSAKL